jgi:coenzyme PQQ biosynthesis protein B
MHILSTTSATLDDLVEPVDLGQAPGEMVVVSFTDSDLGALARAWRAEREVLPSLRLANLRDLRHPMSVDLWIDRVATHARIIVVRLLGGLDWWRYGVDRLSAVAREKGIALALLPGEAAPDAELAALSTMAPALAARLRGAELVFFDGTLWRDDEMIAAGLGPKTGRRMGHMSLSGPDGTIAAFRDLGVRRRILIHINNSNPVLLDDSPERAETEAAGWEVAYDGMEVITCRNAG